MKTKNIFKSEKKLRTEHLIDELKRYEEAERNCEVGSEEHERLRKAYSETMKLAFPTNSSERNIKLLEIFAPLATGAALAVFAYYENSNLKSKDGDVNRIAMSFIRRH